MTPVKLVMDRQDGGGWSGKFSAIRIFSAIKSAAVPVGKKEQNKVKENPGWREGIGHERHESHNAL